MRNKAFQFAIVLLVPIVLSLANTAGARMWDSSTNDQAITRMVQQKLQSDSDLMGSKINVETKNGEVTLKGVVNSEHDVNRAAKLAHYVDGVRQVDNRLMTEKAQHYKAKAPVAGCMVGANWQC